MLNERRTEFRESERCRRCQRCSEFQRQYGINNDNKVESRRWSWEKFYLEDREIRFVHEADWVTLCSCSSVLLFSSHPVNEVLCELQFNQVKTNICSTSWILSSCNVMWRRLVRGLLNGDVTRTLLLNLQKAIKFSEVLSGAGELHAGPGPGPDSRLEKQTQFISLSCNRYKVQVC